MRFPGGRALLASGVTALFLGGIMICAGASGGSAFPGPAFQAGPPEIPVPAGKARGPWTDARVGTIVKTKDVEPMILEDAITLRTLEVVAADDTTVTIKASGTARGRKMAEQTKTLPRFLSPAELQTLTSGWGRKIETKMASCGGQDVRCDFYERKETRASDNAEGTRITVVSEQVPTWIVRVIDSLRSDDDVKSRVPHEVVSFTWGPAVNPAPAKTDPAPVPPPASQPTPPPKTEAPSRSAPASAPGPAEFPDVPKTAENRALAADVMARLAKEAYTILDTDVTAFDARFAVVKNEAPAGSVRAAWSSEAGQTTAKYQGRLDADGAGWLQTLTTMGLLQSIFTEGDQGRLFGRRTEDGGYVLSDYEAVNEAVASRQVLISADRTQTGEILKLRSGDLRRIVRQARLDGNRLFVKTARILIQAPDGGRRSADFAFETVVKSGIPFVGRMTISDTATDGTKTVWRLDLDSVSFTRPG